MQVYRKVRNQVNYLNKKLKKNLYSKKFVLLGKETWRTVNQIINKRFLCYHNEENFVATTGNVKGSYRLGICNISSYFLKIGYADLRSHS